MRKIGKLENVWEGEEMHTIQNSGCKIGWEEAS
jgi:hypothetical protein